MSVRGFRTADSIAPLLLAIFLIGCWEFAARAGFLSTLLFPAPSAIGSYLVRQWNSGELITNLSATLARMFAGLLLGGVAGLIVGLVMGWSRGARGILDPFVAATNPIPKVAILPLLMVIFGIGDVSKVLAIGLSAFFPMLINTVAGVQQISPIHFDVAKNYGAPRLQIFTRVLLPGSLPLILAGARLAVNVALVTTIAVELISANVGLGAQMMLAWQTLRTEMLYTALFVTALLGILLNFLLDVLTKRAMPWQVERET